MNISFYPQAFQDFMPSVILTVVCLACSPTQIPSKAKTEGFCEQPEITDCLHVMSAQIIFNLTLTPKQNPSN